jgi:benzil reductase ((S)-benzoin forming)
MCQREMRPLETDLLCLITGGSQGLGAALAENYRAHGWTVFSLARTAPPPEESPSEASVEPMPPIQPVQHIACDLSNPAAFRATLSPYFEAWSSQPWQKIHLIHNAARVGAIGPLGSNAESTPEDWQQTLDLNLGAVVHLSGMFIKAFQHHAAQKWIAHVSSGAAHKAYAGWSLYCATKAAMERFALCLAEEQTHEEHPIGSVIINPGVMDTGMQSHIRAASPKGFPQRERFIQLKANDALPQPEAVAHQCFRYLQGSPHSGETFKVIF